MKKSTTVRGVIAPLLIVGLLTGGVAVAAQAHEASPSPAGVNQPSTDEGQPQAWLRFGWSFRDWSGMMRGGKIVYA